MFQVRLTRHGEDAGGFALIAFDVDDAVARAKDAATEASGSDDAAVNAFDDLDGL